MNEIIMDVENTTSISQTYISKGTINLRRMVNSALIMFIVCESMMNTILVSVLPIDNILGYTMLLLGLGVIAVQRIRIDYKIVCIVLYCVLSFIISSFRGYFSDSILYLIQFMSFGMVGIIGAKIDYDYKTIFKASVVVSEIFVFLNLIRRDMIESDFNFGYAIIPGVLSSVFLIYNCYREKKYSRMLTYIIMAVPIVLMFVFRSSRGNLAQLIVFTLLGMFFLFGYKKLAMIITVIGIVALTNLREIVFFLNDWANAHGLTISIIWKTYYLLNTEGQGFSHGRSDLFSVFKQNVNIGTFMFGNGIGSFEHIAGTYPHNILLSAFSDFGFIGVVFLAILLFRFFKVLRDSRKTMILYEREFTLLIFTLSFIKLCFSGVYWNSSTFWYLVSYLF